MAQSKSTGYFAWRKSPNGWVPKFVAGETRMAGVPANINRHTGKPHTHEREIARRLLQAYRRKYPSISKYSAELRHKAGDTPALDRANPLA